MPDAQSVALPSAGADERQLLDAAGSAKDGRCRSRRSPPPRMKAPSRRSSRSASPREGAGRATGRRRPRAGRRRRGVRSPASCGASAMERSPELEAFALDVEQTASSAPAFAAFATARLAELQDGAAGYDAERGRQAQWLAAALTFRDYPS